MLTSGAATIFPTAVLLAIAVYMEHQVYRILLSVLPTAVPLDVNTDDNCSVDTSFRLPSK